MKYTFKQHAKRWLWVSGLFFSAHSMAVIEYDQNVTPDVIFGSGNGNGFFTVERNAAAGVEVGLRAKIPYHSLYNSQGDGTYVFTLAETDHDNDPLTPNRWNIEFSVNTDYLDPTSSGNKVAAYSYELGIDTDPSEGVSFQFSDPINVFYADHSFGDNSTPNGGGVEANPIAFNYATFLNTYNVVQNSFRFTYNGYDPDADATYDVYLVIKTGATILAETQMRVIIGAGGTPVNTPPVITSSPPTSVLEDSSYSYTLTATDADNDPLTFSVVGALPGWLQFDAATGVLSGTPTNADVGSHNVSLQVSDGTATVDQSFSIVVINTNDAPVITSTPVLSINEDQPYTYTVTATDVDVGDTLSYTAVTIPSWLSFNATTHTLSGTPTAAEIGTHPVVLAVSDGMATVNQAFSVGVLFVNDPPSFTVGCELDATDVTGPGGNVLVYTGYVANMVVGPADEQTTQTYSLAMGVAAGGDPDGLVTSWTINNNGDISVEVDTAVTSVATLQVTMVDDGGTANGGDDTTVHSFNIHHYADLALDPNYAGLPAGDILYKNTFDPCR